MCQSAAAFGAGVWMAQKIGEVALPVVRRAPAEAKAFKLRVRVHSASAPGLAAPGLLTQERPRAEVVVGGVRKETEFGDWAPSQSSSSSRPPAVGSEWRFCETLTFSASAADVLGAGAQVRLRTQSDVRLGPVQVSLARPREVGMCSIDLRRRVLPACEAAEASAGGRPRDGFAGNWETPVLTFPLTYVGGGSSDSVLGQAVGSVMVSFSIDSDPGEILRSLDNADRPMLHRMADPMKEWMEMPARWIAEAGQIGLDNLCKADLCRDFLEDASKGFLLDRDRSPSAASTSSGGSSPCCRSPSATSFELEEEPTRPVAPPVCTRAALLPTSQPASAASAWLLANQGAYHHAHAPPVFAI